MNWLEIVIITIAIIIGISLIVFIEVTRLWVKYNVGWALTKKTNKDGQWVKIKKKKKK